MGVRIGTIVQYRLTAEDASKTNARRADARGNVGQMQRERPGYQAHWGRDIPEVSVAPAIVTRVLVLEGSVNLQVFLDGSDSLWVERVVEGDGPGTWSWSAD